MKVYMKWILGVISIFIISNCMDQKKEPDTIKFYVGSSNGRVKNSIYLCELDYNSQKIIVLDSFPGSRGSSYLAHSSDQQFLYSIDKTVSDSLLNHNSVTSFRVDPNTFMLSYLNSQSSGGSGPCHVHCNGAGTFLFAANYGSGDLAAFPLGEEGEILPASDVEISTGSGPYKERQSEPHTHYVSLVPDENYLLCPDLGTDRVLIFEFDASEGTLTPNPVQSAFKLAPGAGPRHLDFHSSGKFLYVVNELNGTVTACSYNKTNGTISEINTVSTLPDSFEGSNGSAAVRVHPNGKFVYASNRGDFNSIAVFSIRKDGAVDRIQILEDVPVWPRDFNIDPTGEYLLVAGERSDYLEVFRIDMESGLLESTGNRASMANPASILFVDP